MGDANLVRENLVAHRKMRRDLTNALLAVTHAEAGLSQLCYWRRKALWGGDLAFEATPVSLEKKSIVVGSAFHIPGRALDSTGFIQPKNPLSQPKTLLALFGKSADAGREFTACDA